MSLWVDKYRPKELSKLDFHTDQAQHLKKLVSFTVFVLRSQHASHQTSSCPHFEEILFKYIQNRMRYIELVSLDSFSLRRWVDFNQPFGPVSAEGEI